MYDYFIHIRYFCTFDYTLNADIVEYIPTYIYSKPWNIHELNHQSSASWVVKFSPPEFKINSNLLLKYIPIKNIPKDNSCVLRSDIMIEIRKLPNF